MKARGVHLHYTLQEQGQPGATIDNPLFDLLRAVHEHGSIQRAAAARGASYRHVWGALKQWQQELGEPLVSWRQGNPARLTPFAERLLWAEQQARVRLTPHIEALRSELEHVLTEALDGTRPRLTLHTGDDETWSALCTLARDGDPHGARLHVRRQVANPADALQALVQGRCLLAGLHLPAPGSVAHADELQPMLQPRRHKLIPCWRRTLGLVVGPGNPLQLHSLADVARQRVRCVQRQQGASTHALLRQLLAQAGFDEARLNVVAHEDSHAALAGLVAAGQADVGLGSATAARASGLDFVPLAEQVGCLACSTDTLEHPAVQALRRVLSSDAWRQAVTALHGQPHEKAGDTVALGSLPPWRKAGRTG